LEGCVRVRAGGNESSRLELSLASKSTTQFLEFPAEVFSSNNGFHGNAVSLEREKKKIGDILNASYIGNKCLLVRRMHGAHPQQKGERCVQAAPWQGCAALGLTTNTPIHNR